MANVTLTTTDAWVPELWATRATSFFNSTTVARGVCSNDYQAFARGSDVIHVPHIDNESARSWSTGSLTFDSATEIENTITPTTRIYVAKKIDKMADIATNVALLSLYTEQMGKALALQFDDDLQDAMDGASAVGTDNVDITDSIILSAQKTLNDNKIPQSGRWLIISPGTLQAFRQEEKYVNSLYAQSTGNPGNANENGFVGRIYEFDVYLTQQPLSGSSGKKSFMGQKQAVQYVMAQDLTFENPRTPHDELADALIAWMVYGDKLMNFKEVGGSNIYGVVELAGT